MIGLYLYLGNQGNYVTHCDTVVILMTSCKGAAQWKAIIYYISMYYNI